MVAPTTAPSPFALERGFVIASAITAIVLGIIALVWPGATLLTVALLFGAFLVVTGIFRLVIAFTSNTLSAGLRWFVGILGALVVVAGVFALANPLLSLEILAYVIAFGWIFDGIAAIAAGVKGTSATPRWLAIVSGVISIIAGGVMLFLPALGIATLVLVGGWILIAIGIATFFSLPKKPAAAVDASHEAVTA
ncbi:MAG: DUF308 domain-containing protein [Microcella sp.]|nr:DUF308 domain-containing protein [Microcella sp.]